MVVCDFVSFGEIESRKGSGMTNSQTEREDTLRTRNAVERKREQAAEARRVREEAMREHQERTALMHDIRLLRDEAMACLDKNEWPHAKEMRKGGIWGTRLHVYPIYSNPHTLSPTVALLGTDGKLYVTRHRRLREIDFARVSLNQVRPIRYGLEEAITFLGGTPTPRSH